MDLIRPFRMYDYFNIIGEKIKESIGAFGGLIILAIFIYFGFIKKYKNSDEDRSSSFNYLKSISRIFVIVMMLKMGIYTVLITIITLICIRFMVKDRDLNIDDLLKFKNIKIGLKVFLVIMILNIAFGLIKAPTDKLWVKDSYFSAYTPEGEKIPALANTPYENRNFVNLSIYEFDYRWLSYEEIEETLKERRNYPKAEFKWRLGNYRSDRTFKVSTEEIADSSSLSIEMKEVFYESDMQELGALDDYFELLNKYEESLKKIKKIRFK